MPNSSRPSTARCRLAGLYRRFTGQSGVAMEFLVYRASHAVTAPATQHGSRWRSAGFCDARHPGGKGVQLRKG